MSRAVHQLLGALHYGDAAGNEALAIQATLRGAGFASEIYAGRVEARRGGHARPLSAYPGDPDDVCLYHFSPGSPAARLALGTPGSLAVLYHNVTPAEFFEGFSAELARLAHAGRRELAAFAPRTRLALGHSEFSRRELEAAGFRATAVLPFALDLAAARRSASPVIRRLYGDGRTHLLCVGRLVPNKRVEDVIRAFAAYRRLDRRSRLLLVGDTKACPRYANALRSLVRGLRVEDVVFAGKVDEDELRACYRLADVLVCLSEHEGYGVPLVEAMLHRVPVIAYEAGAVRETLNAGGVLLRDKRPELIAELILGLRRGGPLRETVLASQDRALAELRALDFGAALQAALAPVLAA